MGDGSAAASLAQQLAPLILRAILNLFLDFVMADREAQRPPFIPPVILATPKIRQLYWCDFPSDARLPEFWKVRPVVILSYKNTRNGLVTVLPCSSKSHDREIWAHKLSLSIDDRESWAICNAITSVSVSRLSAYDGPIKRLSEDECNVLLDKVFA